MSDVVVAGHICLDIIPELPNLPVDQFYQVLQPGKLVQTGPVNLFPGGAVSNTGLAMNRLGVKTRLIGKTGNDELGIVLRKLVGQHNTGLDAGIIVSEGSSTSYTIVINPPMSDRSFLHHPGANDEFCASDISNELVCNAQLFHFGYPPLMRKMYMDNGKELGRLMQRVKRMGVTTSLDMAYPDPYSEAGNSDWSSILQSVLPYVDIFMPSFDEITFMLWKQNNLPVTTDYLRSVSDTLIMMGAKIVMLKLGDKGLYLRTANSDQLQDMGRLKLSPIESWKGFEAWFPCYQVNVVGTTGAGDVTIAGFLTSILKGFPPEKALDTALAVGACNVEAVDALSGLLSWEHIQQRIANGWKKRPL